ncbi:DUF2922 domain-containing protein [Anaeromicrobium sediminis]|uniref:Uncharacterized protein n=1 Tax=Anaeromicrobium sediminis TaxID=1478221 RepID=A0A267MNW9_9FIRM|nr:DUF2922 domain-containing protein [Anaeromicrobium sediminis]PAB60523.1 hypothetical protein CCE28_02990 [Anaeromicrobium sediminis]
MKKLEMKFRNEMEKTSSTRVDHARNDVTVEEVRSAMEAVIAEQVFKGEKGKI